MRNGLRGALRRDRYLRARHSVRWCAAMAGPNMPEKFGGVGSTPTDLALLLEETCNYFEELGLWLFRTCSRFADAASQGVNRQTRNKGTAVTNMATGRPA